MTANKQLKNSINYDIFNKSYKKNKTGLMNFITNVINIYHNVDPITQYGMLYYQKEAFQILRNIVYITRPKIKETPIKKASPKK